MISSDLRRNKKQTSVINIRHDVWSSFSLLTFLFREGFRSLISRVSFFLQWVSNRHLTKIPKWSRMSSILSFISYTLSLNLCNYSTVYTSEDVCFNIRNVKFKFSFRSRNALIFPYVYHRSSLFVCSLDMFLYSYF